MENVGRADSRTRAFGLPQRRQKISRRLGRHPKRQVRLHRVFKLHERQRLRRPPGKKRFRQAAAGRKFQGLCLFVQQKTAQPEAFVKCISRAVKPSQISSTLC